MISSITLFLCVNVAFAGDTVTVNIPGGATQTVSSSILAAMINDAPSAFGAAGATGEGSVVSVTQDAATGNITITTASGQTYAVTSSFIGSILAFY